jgi:hypothetical protein
MKKETCGAKFNGSTCKLLKGHDGPHVYQRGFWGRFVDGLGEAIGESLFGGGR